MACVHVELTAKSSWPQRNTATLRPPKEKPFPSPSRNSSTLPTLANPMEPPGAHCTKDPESRTIAAAGNREEG